MGCLCFVKFGSKSVRAHPDSLVSEVGSEGPRSLGPGNVIGTKVPTLKRGDVVTVRCLSLVVGLCRSPQSYGVALRGRSP